MLLHAHLLTKEEIEYLLRMPLESDESNKFHDKLWFEWQKHNGMFKKRLPGRWDLLVWFAQQERIMEVDEMMAAIRRFGDEETFEMLKVA